MRRTARAFGALAKCRHTPCPSGYVQWHEWAERKAKTHEQVKCPGCGAYALWIRKPKEIPDAD